MWHMAEGAEAGAQMKKLEAVEAEQLSGFGAGGSWWESVLEAEVESTKNTLVIYTKNRSEHKSQHCHM